MPAPEHTDTRPSAGEPLEVPDLSGGGRAPRLLITAGPTHEPIDAVRFIGNRSSGRVGVSVAEAAADAGWSVTLALGPHTIRPSDSRVRVLDYRSTSDLEALLREEQPDTDVLIMAAAVADYRPRPEEVSLEGKRRRTGEDLVIRLESTPDLLAGCATRRREDQTLIGFALEPREEMLTSAARKLEKKRVDAIIANPLETMDAERIEAVAVIRDGMEVDSSLRSTGGEIAKGAFGYWLVRLAGALMALKIGVD